MKSDSLINKFLECKKNLMNSAIAGSVSENKIAFEAALEMSGYKTMLQFPEEESYALTIEECKKLEFARDNYEEGVRPQPKHFGVKVSEIATENGIKI